jgi:hypothetical protein
MNNRTGNLTFLAKQTRGKAELSEAKMNRTKMPIVLSLVTNNKPTNQPTNQP